MNPTIMWAAFSGMIFMVLVLGILLPPPSKWTRRQAKVGMVVVPCLASVLLGMLAWGLFV